MGKWLCVMTASMLSACTPLQCQKLALEVYPLDGQPRPAGRLTVRCDQTVVLEATAPTLTVGSR